MKASDRFLFCAETLDGRIFHLSARCLDEALDKANVYVDAQHKDDLVASVAFMPGDLLEDEPSDTDENPETETKREKLALVIGRIEDEKTKDEPA